MTIPPTTDDIIVLIRNHFEKCLIEAECSIWLTREATKCEDESIEDIEKALAFLRTQQHALRTIAMTQEYGPLQEKTARELLTWKDWTLPTTHYLFQDLARGITDAQIEANRMHIAHLSYDTKEMPIQAEMFLRCRNYLQWPDRCAPRGDFTKPYHELDASPAEKSKTTSLTISAAIDAYMAYKQRENTDWQRSRNAFFDRLKEILGRDTHIADLTDEDGFRLEAALWKIPQNYTKIYANIPLTAFINGEQKNYTPIKTNTVKMYWQAIKAFFT